MVIITVYANKVIGFLSHHCLTFERKIGLGVQDQGRVNVQPVLDIDWPCYMCAIERMGRG